MKATAARLGKEWPRVRGLVCPPFTPYTAGGEVNFEVVPSQIDVIAATGVSAVFLGGTGSEGASQTIDERVELARVYKETFQKKGLGIKLIQHVGATSLKESRELAERAEALGVDAVASVTPSFFKPGSVSSMVDWLGGVAEAAPNTPFYYYHIPVMTGLPPTISVKKFLEAAGPVIPNLHGVKYTSQNLCEYADLCDVDGGRFDVMAGLSEQMLAALAMGAQSSVSVPYNLPGAMRYYHSILKDFKAGNLAEALKTQKVINKLSFMLQHGGHGHAIAVMRAIFKLETGLDLGPCRSPLQPLSESAVEAVGKEMKTLGFL